MAQKIENSKSDKIGILPRRFTMTLLFIICYTIIHIIFEYKFWVTGAIFEKYAIADSSLTELDIAKIVYFTKATWMFAMVWMLVLGMKFRPAIAYSFLLYSIELIIFLPFGIYTVLNLLLASGCVIEDIIIRIKARRDEKKDVNDENKTI